MYALRSGCDGKYGSKDLARCAARTYSVLYSGSTVSGRRTGGVLAVEVGEDEEAAEDDYDIGDGDEDGDHGGRAGGRSGWRRVHWMCWRPSGAAVMCVVVLGSEGAVDGGI